jgi:gas vesicle protein
VFHGFSGQHSSNTLIIELRSRFEKIWSDPMNTQRHRDNEHDDFNDEASPARNRSQIEVRKRKPMSDKGLAVGSLLFGFGLGVGLAILFAPQSGEETREWLSANAEDQFYRMRRRGRRLVFETQDLLDRGEQQVNKVLRTGRNALDSVASKLE